MAFHTRLYGRSTVAAAALTLVLGASAQATHNYSPQAEIWERCQVRIGNIIRLDPACVERNAQALGLAQPPLGLTRPPESDLPGRDFGASAEPDVATGTDQEGDQDTGGDQQAGQDTGDQTGSQNTGQDPQAGQDTGQDQTGDQTTGQDQTGDQTTGQDNQAANNNGNGGNPGFGNPGNDPGGDPSGPGEDVGAAGEAPGNNTQADFGNNEDGEPGVRGRSDADTVGSASANAGVNASGRGR